MELTASERETLDAIRLGFLGERYAVPDEEMRPPTKAEYRAKRVKLATLKKAWGALDRDTQWRLVCCLNEMWTDEAEDLLPEIGPVVDRIFEDMKKPSGTPEQLTGLRAATALLWSAWCKGQLGGDVPIGRAAVTAIGAAVSSLFEIDAAEAERRVGHALRAMEKDGSLPRRGTTRRE